MVVGKETARSPQDFYELLCDEGVTVLNQTPSAFQQLLAAQAQSEREHGLRTVIFGGEALEVSGLGAWYARNEEARTQLVNMYGITETTVHVTYLALRASDVERVGASPIGERIGDLRVYVLDERRRPAPVGVTGELYVGGAGVARGYLNRPELTAERFVADPFAGEAGARMYKTGDLGRWQRDGRLEYLGRNDAQVKVRGHRIELGEIEARLREVEGVEQVAVVAREDEPGDKRLVAYYAGANAPEVEALRAQARGTLAEYMVPSAYVRLEALPLTRNGKLDRRALPAPDADSYGARGYEAPRGAVEETLAGIWADVLRVERVGRHDNFFELGGHSLLAVKVASRVRRLLGVSLSIGEIFSGPTLADLAVAVGEAEATGGDVIPVVTRGAPTPVSLAQRRLWFLAQFEPAGDTYHIAAAVRLEGELDRSALVRALDRVVERHEALRTRFEAVDGEPMQVIDPPGRGMAIEERDLRVEATGAQLTPAELDARLQASAARPFDLRKGPPIRASLIRTADREHVLAVVMHHIVSDDWSLGILASELSALYRAYLAGETDDPPALPTLTVQYVDFSAWQRARLTGAELQRQADYWQSALAGAPEVLDLPTDHPRPPDQDYAGDTVPVVVDRATADGLRELGHRQGGTLYTSLLAGWAALLARFAGQSEVVIGSPIAGRGHTEIEPLIGFFVNTLALRIDLDGSLTTATLLRRVQQQLLAAQQHQDLPFEQVVELVQPARSLARSPIFQAAFAWQNAPGAAPSFPGLELSSVGIARTTSMFDLTLELQETEDGIVGALTYATALWNRATVDGYVRAFVRLLAAMVTGGDEQPVARLDCLGPEERRQMVEEWNATSRAYPREAALGELFAAQAAARGEAVALIENGRPVSYGVLEARANQVARALVARGVSAGAGDRVAVALERSIGLIEAELGVVKAGGAYVPLDGVQPGWRQAQMVSDSGARWVVSARGRRLPEEVEALGIARIDLEDEEVTSQESSPPVVAGLDGASAAYVMYTSGSTGEPRGVVVPHRAVSRLVLNNGYAEIGVDDRVAVAANVAFDASTLEVWGPLLNGATGVIVAGDEVLDAERFARRLEQDGVTVLWMTVGLFNQYARALGPVIERLKYLIVGGEALDAKVIGGVLREHRPRHLLNGYGPTETTTFALTHEVREVADDARSIPLG
ncbi:MAG TPA: condensation domain-containing protein, partial [Polyangia bacterium]|nr:condensation domain-containing protein [Polyangia bacterium]